MKSKFLAFAVAVVSLGVYGQPAEACGGTARARSGFRLFHRQVVRVNLSTPFYFAPAASIPAPMPSPAPKAVKLEPPKLPTVTTVAVQPVAFVKVHRQPVRRTVTRTVTRTTGLVGTVVSLPLRVASDTLRLVVPGDQPCGRSGCQR